MQADLELEKGGLGARKRRRGVPGLGGKAKENIAEAKWMVVDAEGKERTVDGGVGELNGSPRKGSAGLRDEDAFVVPRKRTNANHLITPRKPLRSIENSVLARVLDVGQSPVKGAKSPAKSPAKGVKVPLNDREVDEHTERETEKPRRRKSMRRSRRLTRSDLAEEIVEERRGSFIFGKVGGDVEFESFSGIVTPVEQANTQSEETSAKAEDSVDTQGTSSVPDEAAATVPVDAASEIQETVAIEQEADALDDLIPQAAQLSEEEEIVQHEASEQVEEQVSAQQVVETSGDAASKLEEASDGVHEDLEKQSGLDPIVVLSITEIVQLETIEKQAVEASIESNELQPATTESPELEATSEHQPQTPLKPVQLQPTTLQSTEPDMTVVLSPTKSVRTPRTRRETPQRSATRRSTRTRRSSRASSVARGETSVQATPKLEATAPENGDVMSTGVEAHPMDSVTLVSDSMVSDTQNDSGVKVPEIASLASLPVDVQPQDDETVNEAVISTKIVESATEALPEQESTITWEVTPKISIPMGLQRQDFAGTGSLEQESFDEQLRQEFEIFTPKHNRLLAEYPFSIKESLPQIPTSEEISEELAESFELIEPISITTSENSPCSPPDEASEELHESSTPDPTTTELTKAISQNAPPAVYDHDDTDMLRNFLSKVKAKKAAKATTSIPKRKRSLPHSPLQIPLETVEATSSADSPKARDEFDVSLPDASPRKRRKRNEPLHEASQEEDNTEPRSIRRSGRTRLPVKAAPAAPSFIPVRRLGQDGDSTVTLRQNEEKELAALTKVNTRKNKGGASHPADVLAKKADEKDDPAARQRALKEVFDEKNYKQKLNKKGNTVVWAEELAQFQTEEGKKIVLASLSEKEAKEGKRVTRAEREPEREKEKPILPGDEKKSLSASASASSTPKVKVGMRSKMTLGMAANGTPAPKRRVRGRS